jgi:hypothetical protein
MLKVLGLAASIQVVPFDGDPPEGITSFEGRFCTIFLLPPSAHEPP